MDAPQLLTPSKSRETSGAKKVLILSAGFGEGHNAAARGLLQAIQARDGQVQARMVDLFANAYGPLNEAARKAYLATIRRLPKLWGRIYRLLDSSRTLERALPALASTERALRDLLESEKPDVVVATFPVYAFFLQRIYRERSRPFSFVTVVTDSISIHSVWHRAPSDLLIVPNEASATVLREAGVPSDRLLALGFPVAPRFAGIPERDEAVGGPWRVLYSMNGAVADAVELLPHLCAIPGIELTVTAGRDPAFVGEVEAILSRCGGKARVLGWVEDLPGLLGSSHLLIGKAGGATVQEALAARTPLIISRIIPGQEEGNARLILDHQCGAVAETPEAIAAVIRRAFENGAGLWKSWSANIAALSRPAAALELAELLLERPPEPRSGWSD